MRKNIVFGKFLFLFFIFSLFTSCVNLLDEILGTTYDDGTIKVSQVQDKTSYKSFDSIKEPVVINFPVYDDGYNQKGHIMVIYNGEKEEVHDWVYVPETATEWASTAFIVSAAGKNCFMTQGAYFTNFALMDPSKTEITLYPKTKADNNVYRFGLFDVRPSFIPFVNSVVTKDMDLAPYYYFNTFDCSTGEITKSTSVIQEEQSSICLDYDGKSFLYVKSLFGYHQLVKYDPAANTITDLPYVLNFNPMVTAEPFSTFDPKTFKMEENPLLFMHDYYDMSVVYADSKYIILLSKLIIRMDEESTSPSNYLYVFDRTNPSNPNPVCSIPLDDYQKDSNLYFLNEGFEYNGKYYLLGEISVLEDQFSVFYKKLYEIDLANKSLKSEDIMFQEDMALEFVRYGSKIYVINVVNDSNYYIYTYDLATKTKGNSVTISRENLNLKPIQ